MHEPTSSDPSAPQPHLEPAPRQRIDLADDTGAQAMEYAMLGGAGVASVSVLTWLLRQDWFEEAVRGFIEGLFGDLIGKISELLPSIGGVL